MLFTVVGGFLAVVLAVTAGICFGWRDKPVTVDDVGTGNATVSANYTNLTGNQVIEHINNGTFTNNNYIDYTYNGSYYSVTLPMGTYDIDLWGAQGGRYNSSDSSQGGKGGHIQARVVYTRNTTIYIYIGAQGASGSGYIDRSGDSITRSGGYNGGGYGTGYGGSGGGGATDVRTTAGSATNSTSYNTRVLVAAGGGGGTNTSSAGTHSGNAGIYYGANGCRSRHRSSYSNDEAGGGGGYYGGTVNHGDDPLWSYAGSNYIGSGYTSRSNQYNIRTGNGSARITAVNVNKPPETRNANITVKKRDGGSTNIAATTIASDTEGVYFTDANASAANQYDTFTKGPNQGIWYNSSCNDAYLASKYITWTWSGNTSFNVTNIVRYPRSGVDGSTKNGEITLYTRVRDGFGTSGSARGYAVISFKITVPHNTIAERTRGSSNSVVVTKTTENGVTRDNNRLFVGRSNTTSANFTGNVPANTIYNPINNRYTAIFEQPIKYNEPVTIKASDLVLGDNNGAICGGNEFVVAINSTTAITGNSRKFRIDEYESPKTHTVTAYNASRVAIANAFSQLSFRCLTPDPTFQVFTVTVYQVEVTTAYTSGVTTRIVPDVPAVTVDIVFKMDNTRPVMRDAADITGNNGLNENLANVNVKSPVVEVQTLKSKSVSLNDFFCDADTPTITTSTHQIRNVIVAEREFVQLDKYGKIVSTVNTKSANTGKSFFNVVSNPNGSNMFKDSLSSGMFYGGDFETGFTQSFIHTGNDEKAYISYSFSGITLNITGLRATHDMYDSARTGKNIATGGSTADGATLGTGGALNAGHFYILINIQDKNDTADTGIWLPLGIRVANSLPTATSKERGGAGAGTMPNADGKKGDSFYFTPMGITIGQRTTALGYYLNPRNGQYENTDLQPLASDADNFYTSNMLNGEGIGGSGGTVGVLNELITIVSSTSDIQNSVKNVGNDASYNAGGEYFSVSEEDIFIPEIYFGGRISVPAGSRRVENVPIGGANYDCIVIKGLKITLNGWTHNRFLHAKLQVRDSAATKASDYVTVEIAVNVNNSAPRYATADEVARLDYEADGKKISTSYSPSGQNGIATYTYNVPVGSTFIVTPYDFVRDENMPVEFPSSGFTLNGLTGLFDSGNYTLTAPDVRGSNDNRMTVSAVGTSNNNGIDYSSETYKTSLVTALNGLKTKRNFGDLSSSKAFNSCQTGSTNVDRLYFARNSDNGENLDGFTFDPYKTNSTIRNDFVPLNIVGRDFVSGYYGSKLNITGSGSFDIDFLVISTTMRTQTAAPAEIILNIRDRMGAGASGDHSGVTSVRIVINVINSKPRVQYPNKVYTLSTNPLDSQGRPLGDPSYIENDASSALTVTPSVLMINATSGATTSTSENFLIDDEDGSNVSFYTANQEWSVVDGNGNATDGPNGVGGYSYLGNYLNVSITPQTITITALNSTQAVRELYLEFWVTDGRYDSNGAIEISKCRIRIEVTNSYMQANTVDNGFEDIYTETESGGTVIRTKTVDNLWNIQSINDLDMKKDRYFVSGVNSETIVREGKVQGSRKVPSAQIKRVVYDTDGLQGAILSPSTSPSSDSGFINANFADCQSTADYVTACKNAVPLMLGAWGSGTNPPAVAVRIGLNNLNAAPGSQFQPLPSGAVDSYGITYFVYENGANGAPSAYTVEDLTGTVGDALFADETKRALFFDDQGRWIVRDWAIRVKPAAATVANSYIGLQISMRDETRYGGSTAGRPTGYNSASAVAVNVIGSTVFNYNLFVNGLGIIPYTYYNQFDGYYTVAEGETTDGDQIYYVPTYDGNNRSVYDDTWNSAGLYLKDDKIVNSGTTPIKTLTENTIDNTLAGVHSGVVFDRNSDDYDAGYVYSVREQLTDGGSITASDRTESAFRYSDTINVRGDGQTYVPMSYFALRKSLVSAKTNIGSVEYYENNYIAYDLPDMASGYNRNEGYQYAVSISDGEHIWRGVNGEFALNKNPYVTIVDYEFDNNTGTALNDLKRNVADSPYLNRALSVATYSDETVNGFMSCADNYKSLVGNGHIMYLEDQFDKLVENKFGLVISKKNTRASGESLTISVSVAQCSYSTDLNNTVVNYDETTRDINTATVTFKLAIENSPIDIVTSESSSSGATVENNGGYYYTQLELNTSSGPQRIVLSRNTTAQSGAARVIGYSDADKVVKTPAGNNQPEVVDDNLSDKAKFYAPSLNRFGMWENMYGRVKAYSGTGSSFSFVNTSTASGSNAQNSIRNYLNGVADTNAINAIDNGFKPNGGIYGDINGFNRYFDASVSQDGTALTITPRAKTVINDKMLEGVSDLTAHYAQRGLVYRQNGKSYYPLKVLIYDDHGDGFGAGSYVALEVRVNIVSSAAALSDTLQKYRGDNVPDNTQDKQITVQLPVGQQYQFSIKDVITPGNLLTNQYNQLFWEEDYLDLKENTESTDLNNMFRLETGLYLMSPFENWNPTTDTHLRDGSAGFSNSQTDQKYGTDVGNQPAVAMYMDYYTSGANGAKIYGPVSRQSKPDSNSIYFTVNRRMTYTVRDEHNNDVTVQQNRFSFRLSFKDSDGHSTSNLYVILEVTNKTPTVLGNIYGSNGIIQNGVVKMRVGDSFTLITTPYDKFTGSDPLEKVSAGYSTTHRLIAQKNIGDADLLRDNAPVKYSQLTASALEGQYKLHDYIESSTDSSAQHLGYLAVADDDTPWGLRIENVKPYITGRFDVPREKDKLPLEGNMTGETYALSVTLTAMAVCTNMPITVTLVDANDARVTFTMYVTVESSRPLPIQDGNPTYRRHAALTQTSTVGLFETYMVTSAFGSADPVSVRLDGSGNRSVNAYGVIELPVGKIAYDPDEEDHNAIALYTDNSVKNYNVFTLNGVAMARDGSAYVSDCFRIEPSGDLTSFTIKCLTYNASRDYDTLGFYVKDVGNNVFDRAVYIQIRIYTLYSSIVNETQATTKKIINQTIPERGVVDNINVKPVDDYNGISVELQDDEDLLAEKYEVASTYQFLQYVGEHISVDQTLSVGQGIKDYDVIQNDVNLRYGMKIYAFLDPIEQYSPEYKTASLTQISALFDFDPRVLTKNNWYLKNPEQTERYLIGGYNLDGSPLGGVNEALVMFINRYFIFEIGADGVSLEFRPVTSNINVKIPFYVELEKNVGSRSVKPADTAYRCGTIFYVDVLDSTPIATERENILSFTGCVGESGIFKIHDRLDPNGSLFRDSDTEDTVSASFGTYADALRLATEAEIDWDTNGRGKKRAIDIEINNTDDDDTAKGIPAHSLKISIARRIDFIDESGNYLSRVTLPVIISGKDKSGKGPEVILSVTIENTGAQVDRSKITPVDPDSKNGYYMFTADAEDARLYYLDAYVVPGKNLATFNFISGGYIIDTDYTSREADTESYRLVVDRNENSDRYLEYGKTLDLTSSKASGVVAKVTPVYGDKDMPNDEYHFTGVSIDVLSPNRNIDDAYAYMHIVDRGAGNPESFDDEGFTVMLRIHILNAPPVVKPGKQNTSHILVGSDVRDGDPIVINIADYVEDLNGDSINIIGIAPVINTDISDNEIDPNLHCTLDQDNDGEIVSILLSEDKQSVTVTPRRGFYGYQSLDIMVVDATEDEILAGGDMYTIVTFRHNFTVAYNIESTGDLKRINAIRSLPQKITPRDLFDDIVDLYGVDVKTDDPEGGEEEETEEPSGAQTSAVTAREGRLFNPGDDYVITGMVAQNASGVRVTLDGDDVWTFVCDRETPEIEFRVTFKYKTQKDNEGAKTFDRIFKATVGKNTAPVLLDTFRHQNDEAYLFQTSNGEYGLDHNGTVMLTPSMLFNDVDIARGDALTFDKSATSVVSPTMCSIRISDDGTLMYLTFNMRGETEITVGIKDRTQETVKYTFKIKNIDRPEPSFWNKIVISFETSPAIWWGVGIGLLVLIVFIILLIILLKRRKRKREELEAILISEMELEEQMMRLSGGVGAAQQYQSYGYLPPTMPVQNDPGLMLGSGAPSTPGESAAIGLNPGQTPDSSGGNGNNGVPTDSDM